MENQNQIKDKLYGKTLSELQDIVGQHGFPKFTAKQIAEWLYQKSANSFEQMTNLSKKARQVLGDTYEIGLDAYSDRKESVDGTKKYLFQVGEHKYIETAMIPDGERITVCVSSQVGCKMNCLFCMTGKQGFQQHLTTNQILNQLRMIDEWGAITNIVYMGMGEPMDNIDSVLKSLEIITADWGFGMSPKRVNVSTVGVIPSLRRFLDESKCHLAISLHSPYDEERAKIMPVQKAYKIEDVLSLVKQYDFAGQRRVSFEYIVFTGLNDTPKHARAIVALLKGLQCRMNLIRFHEIPDTPLKGTDEGRLQAFKDILNEKGLLTTIRASRGEDIYAACGLLSTKKLVETKGEN
ncbi:23S rRNA (adenine(2503)-C(2))-methyltransferase RlmN [Halosquirtibacter xylanolyticus]|uniref:23S rRNA (adenine(2503)-C(2))-methyltransferase RlmN n=1 Tax=Halosquirtibacter xylanolyticus TaxID=3374599 RepID=UPI003748E45A|nr:23S rRNA (adenine(2503)-C(2))-methyltransferase RlmN [Prolixibacteraceae bacterium]